MAKIQKILNYAALGPVCVNVIGSEMQRLGCKYPPPGCCFTIEHDKEYKPTDIDIEYCEQVEEIFTFILGTIAGYYQEKYNNIVLAILVHMAGNLLGMIPLVLLNVLKDYM